MFPAFIARGDWSDMDNISEAMQSTVEKTDWTWFYNFVENLENAYERLQKEGLNIT